jgi:hypothetical protein
VNLVAFLLAQLVRGNPRLHNPALSFRSLVLVGFVEDLLGRPTRNEFGTSSTDKSIEMSFECNPLKELEILETLSSPSIPTTPDTYLDTWRWMNSRVG